MESKITAIKKWEASSSLHELRLFLGAVGYYRDFIPTYSQITNPLCKLLKKSTKYVWNKEQQEIFELLKEKLINAPITNLLLLEQTPRIMELVVFSYKKKKKPERDILYTL